MKMVALMGSPRKRGNTDLLVEAFFAGAKSKGAEVEKVWLNDLRIHGCQACLACHKTGRCRQRDDMTGVYERLLAADFWVLATPVYWWGPTAQLKTAIDRWYCLCYGEQPKLLKGKKMVLLTTCADEPKVATPYLRGMLKQAIGFLQMEWAGEIAVQAGPKGEVAKKPAELARARALGIKAAGGKRLKSSAQC